MKYTIKYKWMKTTKYDRGILKEWYRPTTKKRLLDFGLKAACGAACFGLGMLAGEGMEKIPDFHYSVARILHHISGVTGSLKGLVGLMGGVYGFSKSGTEVFDDNYDKLRQIKLGPLKINLRK